jgi:N-acetyl-gamma-glutamyl-phosphate reductase
VIDVKTGISGAGRGGADSKFGYAESNVIFPRKSGRG